MLKKVEMAPCHLCGVISLYIFSTAMRASERTSRLKVYSDIQTLLIDIE